MKRLSFETAGNENIPEKIRMLQFGEGTFLRAFVDEMIDNLNTQTGAGVGVCVAQPLENGTVDALREQDHLYTVMLRGREEKGNVKKTRIIRSIKDSVKIYQEYDNFLSLAQNDDLRFIVSGIAEEGSDHAGKDQYDDRPPASFPGMLTRFLHERFLLKKKGFIFLPCEPIDNNGRFLKDAVLKTAARWQLGDDFIRWVDEENIFCSTLADRIVTGFPRQETPGIFDEIGYEDQQLVTAEPFGLWVIEGPETVKTELPLDQVNPVLFTDNAQPYNLRKKRMLNGILTTIGPAAYMAGLDTVDECMTDEDIRTFLGHALLDEIMPYVPLPREEVERFAITVCQRFENPFNGQALLSVACNSVSKWAAHVLPALNEYTEKKGEVPPCLCFGLAALIMFYTGARRNAQGDYEALRDGKPYPVQDDEYALAAFGRLSCDMPPETLAYAALSDQELWGRDLRNVDGLEERVTEQLRDMQLMGLRAAMKKAWEE